MSHAHAGAGQAVRVLVVTCSDTRTEATDESGQLAEQLLASAGHVTVGRRVVPAEAERIAAQQQVDAPARGAQAVIVNGGTGISRRDRTFDALEGLLEKRIDGFGELFRMLSWEQVGPAAMLSRASAGLWAGRVIFSVPGSPQAVRLAMERLILPELSHAVREAAK